jgi:hypothetical protein
MNRFRIGFFLTVFMALILWSIPVQAQYLLWHYDNLIEYNGVYSAFEPQIAMSGAKVVAVWQQGNSSGQHIYTNYSINGGKTWHSNQIIQDSSTSIGYTPHVSMSGSIAVAVWKQYKDGYQRVYADYSTNGGATWHTDQLIEDNVGDNASYPRVAVSGTKVVAVWFQTEAGNLRIFANYSTNGGATWHTDQRLDLPSGYDSEFPRVALSGNNAVVVWWRYFSGTHRIFANSSSNAGATWRGQLMLEDNTGYDADDPQVAISGSRAVAVWPQFSATGAFRIYSNYTTDAGLNWHADQEVESHPTYSADQPQVAVSGSKVVAVWHQWDGTSERVYANRSTDGGVTWNTPQLIESNVGCNASSPQVAIFGSKVVAVWRQTVGGYEQIYSNFSTNGGATWQASQKINGLVGFVTNSCSPQGAISGKKVVAAWVANDGVSDRIVANYATTSAGQKYLLFPPKLVSPSTGSINMPTTVTLQWEDTNSSPQELRYKIRIKAAGGTYKNYIVAANSTSFIKSGLAKNKSYFWNVQAVGNGKNILNSSWANGGTDFKFTTAK